MIERLEQIFEKYNEIKSQLMSEEVLKDIKRTTELSKKLRSLEDLVLAYGNYKKILFQIEQAKEMLSDPELNEIAKDELKRLEEDKDKETKQLEILLIPKDPNDEKNVILEIRGAAGGDEANIFAGDLLEMYIKYAESKKWEYEIINEIKGSSGGYSQVELMIKGNGVYSRLKYESGAHRVQRVPITESQGRIHTSTSTVIVMPEAEELDFDLDMNDVRIDITRSSGCGGQGVNTTDSAVRLTHIPTGIVVYSQTERSQIKNKDKAIKILKTRLYDLKLQEKEEKEGAERKSKIGTGDRSEKIRTYNYPQNRVTDHRINFTLMELDRFVAGDMDELIDALIAEDQKRKLENNVI
jgi:peptide chain release factor 1